MLGTYDKYIVFVRNKRFFIIFISYVSSFNLITRCKLYKNNINRARVSCVQSFILYKHDIKYETRAVVANIDFFKNWLRLRNFGVRPTCYENILAVRTRNIEFLVTILYSSRTYWTRFFHRNFNLFFFFYFHNTQKTEHMRFA